MFRADVCVSLPFQASRHAASLTQTAAEAVKRTLPVEGTSPMCCLCYDTSWRSGRTFPWEQAPLATKNYQGITKRQSERRWAHTHLQQTMHIRVAQHVHTYSMTMHENPINFKNIPFYTIVLFTELGSEDFLLPWNLWGQVTALRGAGFPQGSGCLGAGPLSLGAGPGLCWRADEQPDMHWSQGATEGLGATPMYLPQTQLPPLLLSSLPP